MINFCKDKFYYNNFDLELDNKKKRDEKNLFGSYYSDASREERVIYGGINFANDLKGVSKCSPNG